MSPIAWAEWVNAYNNVKTGDKIFKNGRLLGVASGTYARCTATSPGSVQLEYRRDHRCENRWVSGQVSKIPDGWELKN